MKQTDKFTDNEKIENLRKNTKNYISKLNEDNKVPVLQNNTNIIDNLKLQLKSKIIKVLIKTYSQDIITYSEYINAINTIIKDPSFGITIDDSDIRKAITYADLK